MQWFFSDKLRESTRFYKKSPVFHRQSGYKRNRCSVFIQRVARLFHVKQCPMRTRLFHVKQSRKGGGEVAGRKKRKTQRTGGRAARFLLRGLLLVLVALFLAAIAQGSVVQVAFVDLPLRDLPQAFDGVKIVYVSDLHITFLNPLAKVNAMMSRLQAIQPDLLILGGDITGNDVIGRMIAQGSGDLYGARQVRDRDMLFFALAGFEAPLGKFAVPGDMDNALERSAQMSLSDATDLGGVKLLRDEWTRVVKDGQSIVICGADDWRTGIQDTRTPARGLRGSDCVILVTHNPEAVFQLASQPGEDGGHWIDAALSGHTLGGQLKLGDYEVFSPLTGDEKYHSGWQIQDGAKILISEGLSGDFLPLRLGTGAQVHVITLRRQTTN